MSKTEDIMAYGFRRTGPGPALGISFAATVALLASSCAGAGGGGDSGDGGATVTIATVANPQMQDIEKLTPKFNEQHPDINIEFVTLPENELRDRVTQDIATQAGQYDVVTIGTYETPIWAENGWLTGLDEYASQGGYDPADIIGPVREALSFEDQMYAAPFYGESSFLMYRKDLFEQAGLTMPEQPTWEDVAGFAERLDNDAEQRAGICLRGLPGWGEVLAPLNSLILTYGGQWYDENWDAKLDSPQVKEAAQFYVDLVREHGQPGAPNAGFSECLTSMAQGNSAMWYDATVAAGSLEDSSTSTVAGEIGYAPAPTMETDHAGWLWAWSLAIPETSDAKDAAWEFVSWATSKEYHRLVGEELGWTRVPPGSRLSTYEIPEYQEAAGQFAEPTLDAIQNVDVNQPGVHPQPWTGVQYVAIPEFQDLGTKVSQEISAAIAGQQSVDEALAKAQGYAEETAKEGGYK
ncbi:ABC transporter substrate-binding protein [Amycolatopsis cihanbeyliensis]|uniref:Carbohydrate ABC transporter substrate-binding protein (CUT1 family) n=1 Tax=Amycolatopsis cihanbeyliensis TaxID=1128664 RepID=A0A542DBF6_AMYCI|nr:sugar ABC transporter substrate-binding protein [Amycolatopsis cihanbeyliensis]TQJ00408.1 carbohydrate ABC transporter substrate-binding protein (CUT1 family) [Amycolatopsis cihanbeyliensis]